MSRCGEVRAQRALGRVGASIISGRNKKFKKIRELDWVAKSKQRGKGDRRLQGRNTHNLTHFGD